MTPLEGKLKRFVEVRNVSEFQTNLQFQIDLESVGLRIADLGQVYRLPTGEGYQWFIKDKEKEYRLIEENGVMRLEVLSEGTE